MPEPSSATLWACSQAGRVDARGSARERKKARSIVLAALALSCSALSACATTASRSYTAPLSAADWQQSGPDFVGVVPAPVQPRVIIMAPPPGVPAAAPAALATPQDTLAPASAPAPQAPFTPTDSPLLAGFDSQPRGQAPQAQLDPLFYPRTSYRTTYVWTPGYRTSYGYGPYYGPGYVYSRPFGYWPYYGATFYGPRNVYVGHGYAHPAWSGHHGWGGGGHYGGGHYGGHHGGHH